MSSSGLMGWISPPRSAKRFCNSGVSSALRTSWFSLAIISGGVPFGANSANQLDARHLLEKLAGEMDRGAVAGRSHCELARGRLRFGDEFLHGGRLHLLGA